MSRHHLRTILGIAILAALVIASAALLSGAFASGEPATSPGGPASSGAASGTLLPTSSPAGPTKTAAATPSESPARTVALGVFISRMPSNPSVLDTFANLIGEKPAIAMWYQPWGDGGTFSARTANAVTDRGAMPLVTWEPRGANDADWALRTIIDGRHDAYIRRWATDVAAWGQPVYVRLMHEMNGNWASWSPNVNGNAVDEFVTAWKHVVDLVRAQGAANIRWVWCPNVDFGNPAFSQYADLYPGDDYVDWACIDGFNRGTTQGSGGRWMDIQTLFGGSIAKLRTVTQKPLMIGETSAPEAGGDKAAWIRDGVGRLPELLPDVQAIVWFNAFEDRFSVNWAVDSSPASLQAFRDVVASGVLSGRVP